MMRQCRWKFCWSTSKLRSSGIFWSNSVALLQFAQTNSFTAASSCIWLSTEWPINLLSMTVARSILHCHNNAPWEKVGSTSLSVRTQLWRAKGLQAGQCKKLGIFINKGNKKNFCKGAQKGSKCSADITTLKNLPQKSWRLTQVCLETKWNRTTFSWCGSIFAAWMTTLGSQIL